MMETTSRKSAEVLRCTMTKIPPLGGSCFVTLGENGTVVGRADGTRDWRIFFVRLGSMRARCTM